MRLLRLLALVAVVTMVYFAQYIFDHGSLADFFPAWLLGAAPFFWRAARWLPEDLLTFAQWLTVIGLLGFGLLSPLWDGDNQRLFRRMRVPAASDRSRIVRAAAWVLAGLALVGAVAVAVAQVVAPQAQPLWWGLVWAGAIVCHWAAGYAAARSAPRVAYATSYSQQVRPWAQWPGLVALLVGLSLLYSFDLSRLPLKVDSATATVALTASRWLAGEESWLAGGVERVPSVASSLTGVLTLAVGDALLGARLAGVVAALATVAAVWLVAAELFRRTPKIGEYGEILEDDGRWMAILAAMVSGIGLGAYHYSRTPYYLEGIALGVFSLWALVRGLRTDSILLLGASGLFLGAAWFYGPVALSFSLAALVWWGGVWLLERSWLRGMDVTPSNGSPLRVQRGAGWGGILYWFTGVLVASAPLLGVWAVVPGAWQRHVTWQVAGLPGGLLRVDELWPHLRLAMLGLNLYPDASGMLAYGAHLLPSLLAPLLALAVGALLLNMDSLAGWTVLTWSGMALLGAAFTGPIQPYWPSLLPLLPAASLALAFVLDRLRMLLTHVLGTWSLQASVYLVLGLIVAAGLFSWIHFYEVARIDSDLATAVGRGIRGRGPDAHVLLLNGQANLSGALSGPVVELLSRTSGAAEVETIQAGAWPEALPNPVRVLVAPEDMGLIPTIYALYPGGEWQVIRNLHANPLLYIYDLPPLQPAGADSPAARPASPLGSPSGADAAPRDP